MGGSENKWLALLGLGVGGFLFLLLGGIFLAAGAVTNGGKGGSGGGDGSGGATVEGDVDFLFTYYDPGQGGINGTNCGGSHGRVCSDGSSPTGYKITEDRTKKKFNGGGAIPQASGGGHSGSVDLKKIPLPYDHSKGTGGKGIIIPCYNEDKPFLPVDHYATSITAPNAIDLAMTGAAHSKFQSCLKKKGVKTSGGHNGFSPATKIKGKIVEMPK